ncbi:DUF397 domain-containing protein [Nocardia sp. CA-120079]|uniref:DUF397 domain-containing protein n=1 Tax=Nocardia sp. CA-120079 TaxID=3239974 RepID=UPI003D99F170
MEAAFLPNTPVGVRDSKNPTGPALVYPPQPNGQPSPLRHSRRVRPLIAERHR